MQQDPDIRDVAKDIEPLVHAQCTCDQPDPVERAERKGAARAYCARCGLPVPVRLGVQAGAWR
jgi:hypothetical protein